MESHDGPLGELGRRATHVALISPLILFLATPFDDHNKPHGPTILTVRDRPCWVKYQPSQITLIVDAVIRLCPFLCKWGS